MMTTRMMARVCVGLVTLLAAACAHDGTLITPDVAPAVHVRAVDQAVLADAIDSAFSKLDVAGFSAGLGGRTLTAYMAVSSPTQLPAATLDYIRERAALVAGVLGIQIREVVHTRERVLSGALEYEYLSYPDTQARVLVLVSYAGVDTESLEPRQRTHGSKEADTILRGRFRVSFGIAPRSEAFTAVTQTVEGESEYPVAYGKYVEPDEQ